MTTDLDHWQPAPLGGPLVYPALFFLPQNDSYRQKNALHFSTFDQIGFLIGVFRSQRSKKSDTFLHNIHPGPFDPYICKTCRAVNRQRRNLPTCRPISLTHNFPKKYWKYSNARVGGAGNLYIFFWIFKESALWADSFYKSQRPSVCPSVRLFTFEVPFKRLFAPTSWSCMS